MENLSLVLASKDLFSSLTTQKIKTLKQAEEYNRQHPNFKVEILLAEYETLKKNVSFEMNNDGNQPWNSPSANSFEKDPLKYYITRPSIIEVLGSKGSGKTALALKLALLFSSFNAQLKVKILNCAGGITLPRLSKFSKINCEYSDIFGVQDLIDALQKAKSDKKVGLLVIDSQVNLLLGYEKKKIGLGELLISLFDLGWSIYYTNFTQSKLLINETEATNHMVYFSQIFGGICQCKLLIEGEEHSKSSFKITMVKSLDSKYCHFTAEMTETGLQEIILVNRS